jgi:lactaldehyde dehydrogenase
MSSGDVEDVKKAISAATNATEAMKKCLPAISRIMYDIHQELKEKHQKLSRLISWKRGNQYVMHVEMDRSCKLCYWLLRSQKNLWRNSSMDAAIAGRSVFGFTIKIPLGRGIAISPLIIL